MRHCFKIILITLGLLILISCGQNNSEKEMKWLTSDTIYEGFPLYLRLPDYKNVWDYQDKFPNLFCISHKLEKVKDNGLPESDYNLSLMDFDENMVDLFDSNNEGIIILIETFGGERNYWYYVASDIDYKLKFDLINNKYPLNKTEISINADKDWGFIKKYPVKLYDKK